jgi:hypothetical protein
MIWSLRVAAALAFAWIVYAASPFVALHSLGRAIEDGDAAAILKRVNFRGIRVSLTKQIVTAYVEEAGGTRLGPADRQLAVQAGMQAAGPMVERLVSPEFIIDLLDDGWPQTVDAAPPAAEAKEMPAEASPPQPAGQPDELPAVQIGRLLRFRSFGSAWQVYARSELHGFRNVSISLPAEKPAENRFRLRLRLAGTTWKLVSLEIPDEVLRRLLRRIPGNWRKTGGFAHTALAATAP